MSGDLPVYADVLIAIGAALVTALVALLGRALDKWAGKLAEQYNLAFIARLDDQIMGYVIELTNTEIEALKAAAADGKLTQAEKDKFKRIAIDTTKKHVGLGKLAKVFGSEATAHAEISARVEKAVAVVRNVPLA